MEKWIRSGQVGRSQAAEEPLELLDELDVLEELDPELDPEPEEPDEEPDDEDADDVEAGVLESDDFVPEGVEPAAAVAGVLLDEELRLSLR